PGGWAAGAGRGSRAAARTGIWAWRGARAIMVSWVKRRALALQDPTVDDVHIKRSFDGLQ
ncbi:MAG: hypothetical protein ACREDT_16650, partial [Methylocella sp.]